MNSGCVGKEPLRSFLNHFHGSSGVPSIETPEKESSSYSTENFECAEADAYPCILFGDTNLTVQWKNAFQKSRRSCLAVNTTSVSKPMAV